MPKTSRNISVSFLVDQRAYEFPTTIHRVEETLEYAPQSFCWGKIHARACNRSFSHMEVHGLVKLWASVLTTFNIAWAAGFTKKFKTPQSMVDWDRESLSLAVLCFKAISSNHSPFILALVHFQEMQHYSGLHSMLSILDCPNNIPLPAMKWLRTWGVDQCVKSAEKCRKS